MKKRFKAFVLCSLLMSGIIFFDRILKNVIHSFLQPGEVLFSSPLLSVVYVQNFGSAFGLFKGQTIILIILSVCILFGLFLFLLGEERIKADTGLRMAIVMILGGAAGNLWDRIADGYVTDFLYLSAIHFPVFNLADVFITLGCALLFFRILLDSKEEGDARGGYPAVHSGDGKGKK